MYLLLEEKSTSSSPICLSTNQTIRKHLLESKMLVLSIKLIFI